MRFRELFDRYLKGEASPEEKEIVENEIEKNEVINDYLAESIELSIPVEGGVPFNNDSERDSSTDDQILQNIQRVINKKLRKTALSSVLMVLFIFLVIRFGVSPLMNSSYYNPAKKVTEFTNQLTVDMAVFTELHFPGNTTDYTMSEPLDYGNYDIKVQQGDDFKRYSAVYEGKIERGEMKYFRQDFFRYPYMNAFHYGVYPYEDYRPDGDRMYREELAKMPESSLAKVYVSFKEDIPISQVTALMKEYNTLYFSWVAVRPCPIDKQQLLQFGFNPTGHGVVLGEKTVDDEKYPHFELAIYPQRPIPSEVMETHFKTLLKYMGDSPDFLKLVMRGPEIYKNTLEFVESNGVKSYGVLVIGKSSDILKLRGNPLIDSIRIDDIKLSSYSR